MSDATAKMNLEYMQASQADKHVTFNSALRVLDIVSQLSVESSTLSVQPNTPIEGQTWIVPTGASGTYWSEFAAQSLAYYCDGQWFAIPPRRGWRSEVSDSGSSVIFNGSIWQPVSSPFSNALSQVSGVGLLAKTIGNGAASRTLAVGAGLSISNADGGLGNPTINLDNTVARTSEARVFTAPQTWQGYNALITPSGTGGSGGLRFLNGSGAVSFDLGYNDADSSFFLNRFSGGIYASTPLSCSADGSVTIGATLKPQNDGMASLGTPSMRYSALYATTGTINTSDQREKTTLEPLPAAMREVARNLVSEIGVFQWRDSISAKGKNKARRHTGVSAQSVQRIMTEAGLNPRDWGLFCEDAIYDVEGEDKEATATRLGLRQDQLFWLLLAGLACEGAPAEPEHRPQAKRLKVPATRANE